MSRADTTAPTTDATPATTTAMSVLVALSVSHLLNDVLQAVLPAIYPLLKESQQLTFTQIGLVTLTYQLTASILQPAVGFFADRRPQPYALAIGMGLTLCGLILLSQADRFPLLLAAAALTGTGSSIFHPEASRLARMASGGRHGFAQSLFQVGGNLGTSIGPLLAAAVVGSRHQGNILWLSLLAVVGIALLARIGRWARQHSARQHKAQGAKPQPTARPHSKKTIVVAMSVLVALIFSKYIYITSIFNYYTFYVIERFTLTIQQAQLCLFVFLFSVAAGTILGGPLGDRFGRKYVIWVSILGVAPFTLALPYANLPWTIALTGFIGVILASAFSAILVYAQELLPGNVGLVAGLFFGLAFGIAGVGSALIGWVADRTSIGFVYSVCSFLPLIGLVTAFLPDIEKHKRRATVS